MTLARSPFTRKPSPEPKPAKGPRLRKCAVQACRKPFEPRNMMHKACSPDCALAVAIAARQVTERKKQQMERAEAKRQILSNPTQKERRKLEAAAQAAVNRVAVLRDWHDGCISCNKSAYWGGDWHGSHYKSVGSNSALRFNLWNISKACSECNWHKSGNIANYVPRLAVKFGADRLDWLQNHPREREYTPEYLARLGAVMRKKARRMEKRLGITK